MGFRLTARFRQVASGLDSETVHKATQATLDGLKTHGGSSVSLSGHTAPVHGWMVGGAGGEKVIHGGPEDVKPEHVKDFIHDNAHHLSHPDHFLGSWHDKEGKKVTLDVSQHFDDRDEAHSKAREKNEDAVYNLHEGKDEPTDWAGQKRPPRHRD